jgi:hypothetical protein
LVWSVWLSAFERHLFVEKLDSGRKSLIDPPHFAFPEMEIDIVRVVELLLLDVALALKEAGVRVLNLRHGLQKVSAGSGTDVLN